MPTRDIECSGFQSRVSEALLAFASDPDYTVQVVTSAAGIRRKRRVWALRTQARRDELDAKLTCAQEHFHCVATSPCGFGECKFANTTNSMVHVDSPSGESIRPQYSKTPTYSREAVVQELMKRERLL